MQANITAAFKYGEKESKNNYRPVSILCNVSRVFAEAVARRCSVKKVFVKILQNPQENTCARVSFLKDVFPHRYQIVWVTSYQNINADLEGYSTQHCFCLCLRNGKCSR